MVVVVVVVVDIVWGWGWYVGMIVRLVMLVTMLADAMLVISDAIIYAVYLGQCISNHSACIHGVLLDAMTSGTYQSTISIVELYYVGRYILINQGYYTKSERGEPMTPAYPMLIPTPIKSLIAKKKK